MSRCLEGDEDEEEENEDEEEEGALRQGFAVVLRSRWPAVSGVQVDSSLSADELVDIALVCLGQRRAQQVEAIRSLELLALCYHWPWAYNELLRRKLWPLMEKLGRAARPRTGVGALAACIEAIGAVASTGLLHAPDGSSKALVHVRMALHHFLKRASGSQGQKGGLVAVKASAAAATKGGRHSQLQSQAAYPASIQHTAAAAYLALTAAGVCLLSNFSVFQRCIACFNSELPLFTGSKIRLFVLKRIPTPRAQTAAARADVVQGLDAGGAERPAQAAGERRGVSA